jgi:CheY-like chemotaxis protein
MILRKVLVVDDCVLMHKMCDLALARYREHGTEVLHARNGAEALQTLGENPDTDLVLLDLNMPVMGGLEFLHVRRERESLWCVIVLVVTTQGEEADVAEALGAGAMGVLTKPLDTEALRTYVDRFFEAGAPHPARPE